MGIPLRYAPEAPKLKQSWVQKEGTITELFKDFVSQAANSSCTQLDKIMYDSHRRVINGVDADSTAFSFALRFFTGLTNACVSTST